MALLEKRNAPCENKAHREREFRDFMDAPAISLLVLGAWDERL